MVAVRRSIDSWEAGTAPVPPLGYEAGGEIAALQAEIERRLRLEVASATRDVRVSRIERFVRTMSVGSGYVALGAGYLLAVGGCLYLA